MTQVVKALENTRGRRVDRGWVVYAKRAASVTTAAPKAPARLLDAKSPCAPEVLPLPPEDEELESLPPLLVACAVGGAITAEVVCVWTRLPAFHGSRPAGPPEDAGSSCTGRISWSPS
jgi:hypothetical protein